MICLQKYILIRDLKGPWPFPTPKGWVTVQAYNPINIKYRVIVLNTMVTQII